MGEKGGDAKKSSALNTDSRQSKRRRHYDAVKKIARSSEAQIKSWMGRGKKGGRQS